MKCTFYRQLWRIHRKAHTVLTKTAVANRNYFPPAAKCFSRKLSSIYTVISNNLKLSDFVLIYLNKDYIPELNIPLDQLTIDNCDITKLFVKESVLDKILPIQYKVKSDIVRFKNIQKVGEPKIKRGDHCSIPYECAFIDYCSRY